ncbi:hypothetical protein N0B16_01035 [Chryseobacterium sp. GMJ5]|uniref:Lipoprotein n=1 Tax=Chryseobacterium gilvum TaxID=2976534 RepID=A0ABT2VTS6_9FLAO|nr:hypothetical protein [Chryseobacterium gilvum]MCU7613013.1 hypothetical protein [Chryseobacterium gilvum]
MKYCIIFFSAFLLIACKKDKEAISPSVHKDSATSVHDSVTVQSPAEKVEVDVFPFPKEIKECSCYFAKNRSDFESEKYIYADDAAKTAYMKLDGKRLALNLISSSDMENDEVLSKEIENENYKISVQGKKVKHEEALIFEGTLTIEKADGAIITMPIYGECGC